MPIARRSSGIALCLALLGCWRWALAADPAGRLLVHASERLSEQSCPVWVVAPGTKGQTTAILLREKFGTTEFRSLTAIEQRVVAISGYKGELVLLLQDRTGRRICALYSPGAGAERFEYLPSLPDRQEYIALAGDRLSLWALGLGGGSSAAAGPAAPPLPQLFQLVEGAWKAHSAPLPCAVPLFGDYLSMSMVDELPTVAVRTRAGAATRPVTRPATIPVEQPGDEILRVYQYQRPAGQWKQLFDCPFPKLGLRDFRLLPLRNRPALWLWPADASGISHLWTSDSPEKPLDLPLPAANIDPADVDLGMTNDVLWMVHAGKEKDRIKPVLQRFDLDGKPVGNRVDLFWSPPRVNEVNWFWLVTMAGLTLLILMALLRRKQGTREDRADPED